MMSCREVVKLVTEYLEETLAPEDRVRFERHVAICPPCRGYLTQMRQTLRVAGSLSEESLSPDAREALMHAFRDWKPPK